jgi:hypothetical protein
MTVTTTTFASCYIRRLCVFQIEQREREKKKIHCAHSKLKLCRAFIFKQNLTLLLFLYYLMQLTSLCEVPPVRGFFNLMTYTQKKLFFKYNFETTQNILFHLKPISIVSVSRSKKINFKFWRYRQVGCNTS